MRLRNAFLLVLVALFTSSPRSAEPSSSVEAKDRQACEANLRTMYSAWQAFQKDNGRMPDWLSDLVPKYLKDTNVLWCPVTRRTGKRELFGLDDPSIPTSYIYEFCAYKAPAEVGVQTLGGTTNMTMQEWKSQQLLKYGLSVPIVRCWQHKPLLNLAYSGEVYESGQFWEAKMGPKPPLASKPQPLGEWFPSGSKPKDYRMGVEAEGSKSGKPEVAVIASQAEKIERGGFGTFMQAFDASKYRGKRVRMSAKVRTEHVSDWAGLWMRVDDSNGYMIGFDNMQNRPIKGTRDWQRYEVVLDVPPHAEMIAAGILMSGTGKAWIADVQFTPVSKQVASTESSGTSAK